MKTAVLFRSYAKERDLIPEVVKRALESAKHVADMFDSCVFLVPIDHDCGGTIVALRSAIANEDLTASVIGCAGFHSCGALNEAVRALEWAEFDVVCIVSNKAVSYLTDETVSKAIDVMESGSKVVGVLIGELSSVEVFPIENTACFWNIPALLKAGGFQSDSQVEEIAPVVKILKDNGEVAVITGKGELNIRSSADGQARHTEVKKEKQRKQSAELKRLGVDPKWVNSRIVNLYL